MKRRNFFQVLAVVPFAAPAAIRSVAATPWRPVEWWVKPFDMGQSVGVAVRAKNVLTGESLRNAVRIESRPHIKDYKRVAEPHLRAWISDLNRGIRRGVGLGRDDILEGKEHWLR